MEVNVILFNILFLNIGLIISTQLWKVLMNGIL